MPALGIRLLREAAVGREVLSIKEINIKTLPKPAQDRLAKIFLDAIKRYEKSEEIHTRVQEKPSV